MRINRKEQDDLLKLELRLAGITSRLDRIVAVLLHQGNMEEAETLQNLNRLVGTYRALIGLRQIAADVNDPMFAFAENLLPDGVRKMRAFIAAELLPASDRVRLHIQEGIAEFSDEDLVAIEDAVSKRMLELGIESAS